MRNRIKEKLDAREVVVGTFLFTPSPTVMEILGHSGLDFAIVDTEHGPTGAMDTVLLQNIIRAAQVSGITPLVRLPGRSKEMTQKVLDAGAMGIVVPFIQTREDAEQIVQDAKYPGMGHRGSCYLTRPTGYSALFEPEYWCKANQNTMVVPLIEDQTGVENAEEILSVEGIDFLFFGGRDHAMTSGYPTVDNPATKAARQHLSNVCAKHDTPLAHFLYPPFEESVKKAKESGARVLVAGGDNSLLLYVCRNVVKAVQGA